MAYHKVRKTPAPLFEPVLAEGEGEPGGEAQAAEQSV
jgi:hypothetical protein